jgi:hypothetical protein
MKPSIWLRSIKLRAWKEPTIDEDGTLDISRIAKRAKLRSESLLFDELAAYEGTTIADIRDQPGQPIGELSDSTVLVGGVPVVAAQSAESSGAGDKSFEWITSMSVVKPELPRDNDHVTRVLFPDIHGKLPVTKEAYHFFSSAGFPVKEYLEEADGSLVHVLVSSVLHAYHQPPLSEMYTTNSLSFQLTSFFNMFNVYSEYKLVHTLLFNCNEKIGDSFSDVTVDRSRPDTLCIASGCTLLISEDKFRSLHAAQEDLRKKVKMLPPIYYGELEFILRYVAAGSQFQWVYVGRNGLSPIRPCLDLSVFEHRCKFYLSLGYAYHLLCSMVDAIPVVQSNRAMFSRDENGDMTIDFYPDYVRKTLKNFDSYCKLVKTTVDAVGRAYEVSAGCSSLLQLISCQIIRSRTYIIEIKLVGYPPSLRFEQDVRNMARCVCEALYVLHMNGLVHRDIRLPNILQIAKDQFMLINLEAAATCSNRVPPGFLRLQGWSGDVLEGGYYTMMSDMYHFGQLLASMSDKASSPNAEAFI